MIIPWENLSRDALTGVIEDFVTREGTEYGASEIPLEVKVAQIESQLKKGAVVIVYDEASSTSSIRAIHDL